MGSHLTRSILLEKIRALFLVSAVLEMGRCYFSDESRSGREKTANPSMYGKEAELSPWYSLFLVHIQCSWSKIFLGGIGPNEAGRFVEFHRIINAVKFITILEENL